MCSLRQFFDSWAHFGALYQIQYVDEHRRYRLDGMTISEVLGDNINIDNVTGFLKSVGFYKI